MFCVLLVWMNRDRKDKGPSLSRDKRGEKSRIMETTTYGYSEANTVLLQMVDNHDLEGIEAEVAEIRKLTDMDFSLTAVKVSKWNADLSPWAAPAVFGREGFGIGAADTLDDVVSGFYRLHEA